MLSPEEIHNKCERILRECEEKISDYLKMYLYEAMNADIKYQIEMNIDQAIEKYVNDNVYKMITIADPNTLRRTFFNLKWERWDRIKASHGDIIGFGDSSEKCFFDENNYMVIINSAYIAEKFLLTMTKYV